VMRPKFRPDASWLSVDIEEIPEQLPQTVVK
jgi:hypothetical protein